MTAQEFAALIDQGGWKVKQRGAEYRAQCPAHDGDDLNLSFRDGDTALVVSCKSHGCEFRDIMAAVERASGKQWKRKPNGTHHADGPQVVARYSYTDEQGNVLYQVWRYSPKTFKPHTLNERNEWVPTLPRTVRRVLYRLPELLAADPKEPVFIANGEKAVDCLRKRGLVATCSQGGESIKWRDWPQYAGALKGRFCVILQDNDPAGERHTQEVFAALTEAGVRAKKLLLPSLPEGGDVVDWLEAGATTEELLEEAKPPPSAMAAKVLTGKQLLAADLPSADWIVEGIIAQRMVQLIAGREKTGKSVLTETLCLAAAAGGKWIGQQCRQTRTLFINWEDPLQITQGRLRKHLAPGEEPPDDYLIYPPPYTTSLWQLLPDLKQLILEMQIGLCIIDPIARAAKWKDENDASETAAVFEALQELGDQTGCSFVPVHHANKGEGQFGDVLRGSTAIPAGVIGFSILKRTKLRREFEFETIHKLAMGDDVTRILTRDRRTMTWELLRTVDHSQEGDEETEEAFLQQREVLKLVSVIEEMQGSEGVTQAQLTGNLGWSRAKLSRRLAEAEGEGLICHEQPVAVGRHRPPAHYWVHPRVLEGGS